MNIDNYIVDIHSHIIGDFEDYKFIFLKYERILQKEIKENPQNIRAVSLLAMIKSEIRKNNNTALKYLEVAYKKYKCEISNKELALISTNLAHFYIEEYEKREKEATQLLLEAINVKSPYAQTYYALALLYYNNNEFLKALPFFEKAYKISPQIAYKFNYAICLFKTGNSQHSIKLLDEASEGWGLCENNAKAYFALGNIYVTQGNVGKARKVALDLLTIDYYNYDIEHLDFAELMFFIGDYEKSLELFEKSIYAEDADWIYQYFYCLKVLNRKKLAEEKLKSIKSDICSDVNESIQNSAEWKKDYLEYYEAYERKRLDDIIEVYDDVFIRNIKPCFAYKPYLLYKCYYIDCPRHSVEDIEPKC